MVNTVFTSTTNKPLALFIHIPVACLCYCCSEQTLQMHSRLAERDYYFQKETSIAWAYLEQVLDQERVTFADLVLASRGCPPVVASSVPNKDSPFSCAGE